jgi:site-specific recombinase XerD
LHMAAKSWDLDEGKFLSLVEVRNLLKTLETHAACPSAKRTAIRNCFLIHLGLATGLRVGEMANLKCGDIFIDNSMSSLHVRRGKGGKPRSVSFSRNFKEHMIRFLRWKNEIGEPVDDDSPVFYSFVTGVEITTRALQKAFKRCMSLAGLSPHYGIHCLRHTYACHLYKASGWNLRLVQKQLGHSRISTTQVYADVMEPDMRRALEKLYK